MTAEWRHLAMLNYTMDPKILAPFVPSGTELDFWNGKTFVSVVGFLFKKTRLCGIPIPFHCNFEEVNLRFYVRRKAGNDWQRAVVFIKEIVPRFAIAFTARVFYNEPYIALPMSHQIEAKPVRFATYCWRFNGKLNFLKIATRENPELPLKGSEPEFITEHYWGCTAQRDGSTLEYRVEHPRWRVAEAETADLNCDVAGLYARQFCHALKQPPSSAFLAEGSAVKVYRGIRLPP
jgi:uncharacterized protein YqjF (DUF2071 family)